MNGAAVIAEILTRKGPGFSPATRAIPDQACAALDIRTILCRQDGSASVLPRLFAHQPRQGNGVFAAQAGPGIENAFRASPRHSPRTSQ